MVENEFPPITFAVEQEQDMQLEANERKAHDREIWYDKEQIKVEAREEEITLLEQYTATHDPPGITMVTPTDRPQGSPTKHSPPKTYRTLNLSVKTKSSAKKARKSMAKSQTPSKKGKKS